MKTGLKLGPALKINMETSTNEETDQVKGREDKDKDADGRKTRSNSLTKTESANNAPEDENLKEGTKESAKPETVENPKSKKVKKVNSILSMD